MLMTVVDPTESTRTAMEPNPDRRANRSARRAARRRRFRSRRASPWIRSRWIGALICAVTALSALADTSVALTATLAALGALCFLALGPASTVSGRRQRGLGAVAARIQSAPSMAAIEDAARAEIESWPDVQVRWCVIAPAVAHGPRGLAPAVERDVEKVTVALRNGDDLTPARMRFGDREVIAAPCAAGLSLVLVVCGPTFPRSFPSSLSDLAVLVGVGARQLELGAELAARHDAARFEKVVQYASDAIFVVGGDGIVLHAAPSVTSVLGFRSTELERRPLGDLVTDEHADTLESFLVHLAAQDARDPARTEMVFRRADGSTMTGEVTGANLLDDPDVGGMMVTIRDVSERRELERQLRHQAFHDNLTGLANRALFNDRLDHRMKARRDAHHDAPAIVFIDLDDFKDVNDSFGHAAGDELLLTVAQRIQSCLRKGDTAARLGGDEFAVLLDHVRDGAVVVDLAQRVLDALSHPVIFGDEVIDVRASVGVATATPDVVTSEDLLRHADQAMYRAKVTGKGRVVGFEPDLRAGRGSEVAFVSELDTAIRDGDLDVHYQPVVSLTAGTVVAVEALVRWPHRVRGMLVAEQFVPTAEDAGLVVPMGLVVLRRALRDVASWRGNGLGQAQLSVNVSPAEFTHPDFEGMVLDLLAEHEVEPHQLILEVTEAAFRPDRIAHERVETLAERGISIAVDDFGTGESSLQDLGRLPLLQLKIDRRFVAPLARGEAPAMAHTIIELARSLGADPVAEGIEEAAELHTLRELGCTLGQGNLLAPPAPPAEVFPRLGELHTSRVE